MIIQSLFGAHGNGDLLQFNEAAQLPKVTWRPN